MKSSFGLTQRSQRNIATASDCLIAKPPVVEGAREELNEGDDLIIARQKSADCMVGQWQSMRRTSWWQIQMMRKDCTEHRCEQVESVVQLQYSMLKFGVLYYYDIKFHL